MRVLVSDLTLNSLDDPRDRLAFESNPSQNSRLHAGGIVQELRFRWLFRADERSADFIIGRCSIRACTSASFARSGSSRRVFVRVFEQKFLVGNRITMSILFRSIRRQRDLQRRNE